MIAAARSPTCSQVRGFIPQITIRLRIGKEGQMKKWKPVHELAFPSGSGV